MFHPSQSILVDKLNKAEKSVKLGPLHVNILKANWLLIILASVNTLYTEVLHQQLLSYNISHGTYMKNINYKLVAVEM